MDLHSYAKRRASKKWSVEQKRKLVEARITHDIIFSKKPLNCLTTWKKLVSLAKLDDFNVSFVRKQWSTMVAKYKQYKRSRLGNLAANIIDDELLRKVSQEWEFFAPIHTFMSRKITNLHSYALQEGQKQKASASNALTQQQQDENNASLACQLEKMLAYNNDSSLEIGPAQNLSMFSSDTNEDYAAAETIASETVSGVDQQHTESDRGPIGGIIAPSDINDNAADLLNSLQQQSQNTDHDFYSKKSPEEKVYRSDDESEDDDKSTQVEPSMDIDAVTRNGKIESKPSQTDCITAEEAAINTAAGVNRKETESIDTKLQNSQQPSNNTQANNDELPSVSFKPTSLSFTNPAISTGVGPSAGSAIYASIGGGVGVGAGSSASQPRRRESNFSERDKYYRHKRRFNRRLERRFDSLLNVFGQIVKAEYSSIDVRPLLGTFGLSSTLANGLRFPDQRNGTQNGESTTYSKESSSEDAEMSSSSSSISQEEHAEL